MKKFLIAIAALTTVAATPAFATDAPASNLTYNLSANVSSVCGVYRSSGSTVNVPFNDLAQVSSSTSLTVSGGSASYRCNSPVGFTRTIASVNSGKLVRAGSNGDASNSIPFKMTHGGGSSLDFVATSLSSAISETFPTGAFLSGQTGSVNFIVNGVADINTNLNNAPGTTVFAGTYSDTVTISVTAS